MGSFRLEENIPVNYTVVGKRDWLEGCMPAGFPRNKIIQVDNSGSIDYVNDQLVKMGPKLGCDTESTGPREKDGLDPVSPTSRLLLLQLGTPKNVFLIQPELAPGFKGILESDKFLKILQNGVHDFRFLLKKYGIHMVRMYCTMLAEQVLTAGKTGFGVGLQELVRRYPPHRIISKDVRSEFIFWQPPFTLRQLEYAARDVTLLFPVARQQGELLIMHNLTSTAQLEFNCIPASAEMALVGIFLDRTYHEPMLAYHTGELNRLEAEVLTMWNNELRKQGKLSSNLFGEQQRTFLLSSNKEKAAALAEIGIEVEDTEYETMIRISHPIGKLLAAWSGPGKICSTYGQGMADRIHFHTGRIHSRFDQMGAGDNAQANGRDMTETIATGRYSSDIQQLPKFEIIDVELSEERERTVHGHFRAKIAAIEAAAAKKAA